MNAARPVAEFRSVVKRYGNKTILPGLSLCILDGEFLTLLGPSGCGKTTALRLLAGFESPDGGEIWLDGQRVDSVPPYRRNINTVFQSYALFPHMTVADNVAFGLRMKGISPGQIGSRVREALELVRLADLASRKPHQLSGGQQQRVALARALVNRPRLLLLDEPMSALDYRLRREMRTELKDLQQKLGLCFVFVTHDQEEALSLSDRVAVMCAGTLQQVGAPREIYENPANLFVARFVGECNILDGVVTGQAGPGFITADVEGGDCRLCTDRSFAPGDLLHVLVRPEDLRVEAPTGAGELAGNIVSRTYKGMTLDTRIVLDSGKILFASSFFDEDINGLEAIPGHQRVAIAWAPGRERVLPAESL